MNDKQYGASAYRSLKKSNRKPKIPKTNGNVSISIQKSMRHSRSS